MKKILFTLLMLSPLTVYAQQDVKADSTSTRLSEVVVTADTQTETAKKVILRPTGLEKRHSTNCYVLLQNMNLPDINVDPSLRSVSTVTGRSVIILINGVEAQPDEPATLAASEIQQIEYQRNPGGKYVGSGAVMNFITVRYDYGGNVYLSADEGFARQYGDYVGMVNFRRKALTLTLTGNGKWDRTSQLTGADNRFWLNDGVLDQTVNPVENRRHTNSQYASFKIAHASDNHSFDAALGLMRNAMPRNIITDSVTYTGIYEFSSEASRSSNEHGISPALKIHYNLFLTGEHTIMANANLRHGHTRFRSRYAESGADEIMNNTLENSILAGATLGYFKSFSGGLSIGVTADEYYNYYRDTYSGSFNSRRTLTNNHLMAVLHIDHNLPSGLSYYISAGLTNLYSTIGTHTDNQMSPMTFYGLTYAINPRHSVSITGNYSHSIYDPSFKNDAVIRTSFFEATAGNPDLRQLNVLQNLMSYNGRAGHLGFSFTYDFLRYFDNTFNFYYAEDNIMYHRLVNEGNFTYHKLIAGLSANLISNKLRLRSNAIYSMNRLNSEYRPARNNDLRMDFGASYMTGDWQIRGSWAIPYTVLGYEGVKVRNPAQYGLSLSWKRGDWAAELCLENFLDRRLYVLTDADYKVYRSLSRSLTDIKGRNISLSVTYILPYGRKTDREEVEEVRPVNSAILRPF